MARSDLKTHGSDANEPLNRATILRAAGLLAERKGLAAVTMRALGQSLGVDASAFYYYFSGKPELLEQLGREAVSHIAIPDVKDFADWREWFIAVALNYRSILIEKNYLRDLIAGGFVSWSEFPQYAKVREFLSSDSVPEKDQFFVIESVHSFVLGAALIARSSVWSEAEYDRESDENDRGAGDFAAALRILLTALIELKTVRPVS
jgi:AcrR family transcriptional regulator